MKELIDKLQTQAGLSPEQAAKAIDTIKEYIQDQLPPMMKGMVDQFLASSQADADDFAGQ